MIRHTLVDLSQAALASIESHTGGGWDCRLSVRFITLTRLQTRLQYDCSEGVWTAKYVSQRFGGDGIKVSTNECIVEAYNGLKENVRTQVLRMTDIYNEI